ncbi:hypothetical protein [Budvicia aquatica]|uniref:hypothetical protein n=1 Tax=Budvicia aquatica TaxID=82979 RepID=UPI0004236903|nr:hypothetical protein [Budvicia aquatica]
MNKKIKNNQDKIKNTFHTAIIEIKNTIRQRIKSINIKTNINKTARAGVNQMILVI